jgi:hypothetical protein
MCDGPSRPVTGPQPPHSPATRQHFLSHSRSPIVTYGDEIAVRTPIVAGYERITGRVHFGLNPNSPPTASCDLEFAPLNTAGEVECAAGFEILQPQDASKGNGTILFEVSNRGGKGRLSRFDFARGANDLGDQWVLQQGYTLVWLGWEWDIPASNRNALHFAAPHFRPDALPAAGLVRSEFTPDKSATVMSVGDRTQDIHVSKPLALYVRQGTDGAPKLVPSEFWTLGADGRSVEKHGGFEAGMLYEFVYEGKGSVIAGAGLAAMRDWISFLNSAARSPAGLAVSPLSSAPSASAFRRAAACSASFSMMDSMSMNPAARSSTGSGRKWPAPAAAASISATRNHPATVGLT